MKVVLATSPHVRHSGVLQSDFEPDQSVMYSFAPIGLLSLAAVLRRDRPDVALELYDLNRRTLSGALRLGDRFYADAAEDICTLSPDVVGFMTECDSYHHLLQIAAALKQRNPGVRIVLGGPHASAVARQTLERCPAIDAIVVGEGEVTLVELLDALSSFPSEGVPGALVRASWGGVGTSRRTGALVDGGVRNLIKDLDELPVPAYDLYRPDAGEEIFLEVGRGCPFQCEFCSTAPYWNRRHRVKSASRVRQEVLHVRDLYGTTRTHFTHDLFTTDRRWVRSVCEALVAAGAPMRWTCSARTDTVDEALLQQMAEAGCDAIYFGIESGSERILKEIRKDIPLIHSFETLEHCRRAGITPNAGFIVGFPTEDETSVRHTFAAYERALRIGCRPAHLFVYCPFVGSSLYPKLDDLRANGHFVDLPLGREVDRKNRERVTSDVDLHGAYFRPAVAGILEGEPEALFAMDEFSPLVEAALAPTLALAHLRGGMHEVFRGWLGWIHAFNDSRGAAEYRRGYGTPLAFASFVLQELVDVSAPPAVLAAARAVQLNLRVAESIAPTASTTMASHRSLVLPTVAQESAISLATPISRGEIAAFLSSDYDVTSALLGHPDVDLEPKQTHLVWQVTRDRALRLLEVNEFVFDSLQALEAGPITAGELVLESLSVAGNTERDPAAMLESLALALREELITV